MPDSFEMTAKPYNGKMQPCKICDITPKEGDKLFMQNIGTEENKKWITSPHEECFKKLQENPELANKKKSFGGKPFVSQKFPIEKADEIYNMVQGFLNSFNKNRGTRLPIEQEAIFVESLFRTLSGNFKP